jgi:hypothetical protein
VDGQTITFTVTGIEPESASRPIEFAWNWDDDSPWGSGGKITHVYTSANPLRSENTPDVHRVIVTATNCSAQHPRADALLTVHSTPLYTMTLGDYQLVKNVLAGESVDHVAHVYNQGTRTDGYSIEVSGGEKWPTELLIPSNGLMPIVYPYNPSALILLNTQIPSDTQKGDFDVFTLTVRSLEKPAQFRRLVFWTGDFWSMYLPLVFSSQ